MQHGPHPVAPWPLCLSVSGLGAPVLQAHNWRCFPFSFMWTLSKRGWLRAGCVIQNEPAAVEVEVPETGRCSSWLPYGHLLTVTPKATGRTITPRHPMEQPSRATIIVLPSERAKYAPPPAPKD